MVAMPAGDRLVAGVDLGGTNVRTCVARADGAILAQARTPTPADAGPDAVVEQIVAGVRQVAKAAGVQVAQLVGVGVGAPGPVTAAKQRAAQRAAACWRWPAGTPTVSRPTWWCRRHGRAMRSLKPYSLGRRKRLASAAST